MRRIELVIICVGSWAALVFTSVCFVVYYQEVERRLVEFSTSVSDVRACDMRIDDQGRALASLRNANNEAAATLQALRSTIADLRKRLEEAERATKEKPQVIYRVPRKAKEPTK